VKLLTISDRAFQNQYETGDLSGKELKAFITDHPETFEPVSEDSVIVPDDPEKITQAI
jgi:molybdopterin biosynthesis enzyme MoaB